MFEKFSSSHTSRLISSASSSCSASWLTLGWLCGCWDKCHHHNYTSSHKYHSIMNGNDISFFHPICFAQIVSHAFIAVLCQFYVHIQPSLSVPCGFLIVWVHLTAFHLYHIAPSLAQKCQFSGRSIMNNIIQTKKKLTPIPAELLQIRIRIFPSTAMSALIIFF